MTRITVNSATRAELGSLRGFAELCDESGQVLGYFTPAIDKSLYAKVKPLVSDKELQRRSQRTGGRTLDQIMADLKRQG